jgi:hypothetical protein
MLLRRLTRLVRSSSPIPRQLLTDLPPGPPVGAVDDVVDYEPSAAASSAAVKATESPVEAKRHVKRGVNDACAKQPDGYGPVSSPDNYDSFMADPQYDIIAENSLTPDGYSRSFCSLAGSVEGNGYLGLYTLKTFDTIQCQQRCDAAPACYGFNVFMERVRIHIAFRRVDAINTSSALT